MSDGESAGMHVEDAVVRILRWASRPEARRAMAGPEGRDLSPTDGWVLGAVVERGPVRVSELAEWQGVDKSTMTPQVRRLEDRGLLRRREDARDRRAVLLEATAKGRRVVDAVHASGTAVFDGVLARWPARERASLARLMRRLADDLDGSA